MYTSRKILSRGMALTPPVLGTLSPPGSLRLYDRIVIPRVLRLEVLDCIYRGHLGINKCLARARMSLWWPGLSGAIEDLIKSCFKCAKELPEPKEPLMTSSFPSRPWEKVSMDLFKYGGRTYLITVDYYSRC